MRIKYIIFLLVFVLTLGFVFAGCKSKEEKEAEKLLRETFSEENN